MKHLSRQTQGLIAVNVAAVIFGSAALFGKLPISPFWIVDMRAVFAATALFAVAIGNGRLKVLSRSLGASTVVSGVILAVQWVTFFISVQLAGVAIATLTFARSRCSQ